MLVVHCSALRYLYEKLTQLNEFSTIKFDGLGLYSYLDIYW